MTKYKYNVLIIDNTSYIRNLIKRAIANKPSDEYDYEFEIAEEAMNQQEGYTLYKAIMPDVVTLDVKNKTTDIDFIKKIKEIDEYAQIIVISSSLDESLKTEVAKLGCYYIQKPFQEAYLWTRLDSIAEYLISNKHLIKKTISVQEYQKTIYELNNKKSKTKVNNTELVCEDFTTNLGEIPKDKLNNYKSKTNSKLDKPTKINNKTLMKAEQKLNQRETNTINSLEVEEGLSINSIRKNLKQNNNNNDLRQTINEKPLKTKLTNEKSKYKQTENKTTLSNIETEESICSIYTNKTNRGLDNDNNSKSINNKTSKRSKDIEDAINVRNNKSIDLEKRTIENVDLEVHINFKQNEIAEANCEKQAQHIANDTSVANFSNDIENSDKMLTEEFNSLLSKEESIKKMNDFAIEDNIVIDNNDTYKKDTNEEDVIESELNIIDAIEPISLDKDYSNECLPNEENLIDEVLVEDEIDIPTSLEDNPISLEDETILIDNVDDGVDAENEDILEIEEDSEIDCSEELILLYEEDDEIHHLENSIPYTLNNYSEDLVVEDVITLDEEIELLDGDIESDNNYSDIDILLADASYKLDENITKDNKENSIIPELYPEENIANDFKRDLSRTIIENTLSSDETIEDDLNETILIEEDNSHTESVDVFDEFDIFKNIEFNLDTGCYVDEIPKTPSVVDNNNNNMYYQTDKDLQSELKYGINNYNSIKPINKGLTISDKEIKNPNPMGDRVKITPPKDKRLQEIYSAKMEKDYNIVFENDKVEESNKESKKGFLSKMFNKNKNPKKG